jgi:hypothetical protein
VSTIATKTLIALGAVAVPALTVAGILGFTLITTVSSVETDVENALSTSRRIMETRVMLEKKSGLVARLPAELDQRKIDAYVAQIDEIEKKVDEAIGAMAANARIVTSEMVEQLRSTRAEITKATVDIVKAAKSFSQTTALELVDGPFEANTAIAVILLEAIASNVEAVALSARASLKDSSVSAWRLSPAGLMAVLLAVGFGLWIVRQSVIRPLNDIVKAMARLAEGNFESFCRDLAARTKSARWPGRSRPSR